jgi:hypothetical protein
MSACIVELAFEFASHLYNSIGFESVEEQNTSEYLLVYFLVITFSQMLWEFVYKLLALLELQIVGSTVGLFEMVVYVLLQLWSNVIFLFTIRLCHSIKNGKFSIQSFTFLSEHRNNMPDL